MFVLHILVWDALGCVTNPFGVWNNLQSNLWYATYVWQVLRKDKRLSIENN